MERELKRFCPLCFFSAFLPLWTQGRGFPNWHWAAEIVDFECSILNCTLLVEGMEANKQNTYGSTSSSDQRISSDFPLEDIMREYLCEQDFQRLVWWHCVHCRALSWHVQKLQKTAIYDFEFGLIWWLNPISFPLTASIPMSLTLAMHSVILFSRMNWWAMGMRQN